MKSSFIQMIYPLILLTFSLTYSLAFDSLASWTKLLKSLEPLSPKQTQVRGNPKDSSCPDGWSEFYYGCYFIPPGLMNYDVAVANCKIMGAKLAEPIDPQVDLAIANLVTFKTGSHERYWLGINDREENNTWVYESSGEPVKYTNWLKGQPDHYRERNCVEVNYGKTKKKWNDARCRFKKRSVCELLRITENFSHYMARHMNSNTWYDLMVSCKKMVNFVKQHNKKWTDLPTFNLECLIRNQEYANLYKSLMKNKASRGDKQAFSEFMNKQMTDEHWRLFLYWILEWEMSLFYLNPGAPEPWPQPLFEKDLFPLYPSDKFSIEDMILDVLGDREKPSAPKPVSPPCI